MRSSAKKNQAGPIESGRPHHPACAYLERQAFAASAVVGDVDIDNGERIVDSDDCAALGIQLWHAERRRIRPGLDWRGLGKGLNKRGVEGTRGGDYCQSAAGVHSARPYREALPSICRDTIEAFGRFGLAAAPKAVVA